MKIKFLTSIVIGNKSYAVGTVVESEELPQYKELIEAKICKKLPTKGATK